MDLARAPRRRPLTARKKGSGYENGATYGVTSQASYSPEYTSSSPGPSSGGPHSGPGSGSEEEWSLYRDALRLFQLIIYY